MHQEYRERFSRPRPQRKPWVSDHGMHHGTLVTHVPWCISGSLTYGATNLRSLYSRRMHSPLFSISVKRPMGLTVAKIGLTMQNWREDYFLRYFLYLVMFMYIYIYITQVFLTIFLSCNPFQTKYFFSVNVVSILSKYWKLSNSISFLRKIGGKPCNQIVRFTPDDFALNEQNWNMLYILIPRIFVLRWRNFWRYFRQNCVS